MWAYRIARARVLLASSDYQRLYLFILKVVAALQSLQDKICKIRIKRLKTNCSNDDGNQPFLHQWFIYWPSWLTSLSLFHWGKHRSTMRYFTLKYNWYSWRSRAQFKFLLTHQILIVGHRSLKRSWRNHKSRLLLFVLAGAGGGGAALHTRTHGRGGFLSILKIKK